MEYKGGLFANSIKIIIILAAVAAGFFSAYVFINMQSAQADSPNVIINEIAWMGTLNSSNDEWIELYNSTNDVISLENWILTARDGQPLINLAGNINANSYFLLERTDDDSVPGVAADLIYAGALGNSGEVLELKDGEGTLIDSLDMSGGWLAGDNSDKQTMERSGLNEWQTSAEIEGTPKATNTGAVALPESSSPEAEDPVAECGNGMIEAGEECDDGNSLDNDGCSAACLIETSTTEPPAQAEADEETAANTEQNKHYRLGAIVINEIVSDPNDADTEWIELYNTLNEAIDVSNWTIEEGSGAKTKLIGIIGTSGADKFLVITEPKGNLNNSGDIIMLRDSEGVLIDQVAYGNWDDGNPDNNAPAVKDPDSIARKIDGLNSYNNNEDFAVTTVPTKGKSNIIKEEIEDKEGATGEEGDYDYSDDIIISEILPDPAGDDSEGEFIELYNQDERDVDLSGWRLGDESTRQYTISLENNIIKAGNYLAIYRRDSKIALNNSGDTVKLYQPLKEAPLAAVEYGKGEEGFSYNIKNVDINQEWAWSEIATPGAENIIKEINRLPEVNFTCAAEAEIGVPVVFDASDTLDPDDDELSFAWDFGDEHASSLICAEHTYLNGGAYTVKLTVGDGQGEVTKESIINILEPEASELNSENNNNTSNSSASEGLIITEFLPNPIGSDNEGEFIELKNISSQEINLNGWQVDDAEGGSRAYTFKSDIWIESEEYYVLERSESSLALNNSSDAVRLFNPSEKIIDEVNYDKPGEGLSFALDNDKTWRWTNKITPGEDNIIVFEEKNSNNKSKSVKAASNAKEKPIIEISLDEISECDIGDLVKASGTVAVLPGKLGTQYFYIVGSPGVQVYNYKKEFPGLKLGDVIEVTGEIGEINNERRIKTKTAEDMNIISHGDQPVPIVLTCEQVAENYVGRLIQVSGDIVERKGSSLYVDDGSDEVLAYIKSTTGISAGNYKEGETITIIGILSRTKSGVRLMPRSLDDMIIKDIESESGNEPKVLGAFTASDVWGIPSRNLKLELFQYLLVIAGVIIVVLSGMLIKVSRQ